MPTKATPLTQSSIISIVDDDDWARSGLGDLISALGYTTRTFASADEFVASGSVDDSSCLITDLHMPGLNGLDLQDRLRQDGHRIPIIILTAYPQEHHRAQAFAGGAAYFLTKPLDETALAACLATIAGR
jgi:FixJ family two-component response regulator